MSIPASGAREIHAIIISALDMYAGWSVFRLLTPQVVRYYEYEADILHL